MQHRLVARTTTARRARAGAAFGLLLALAVPAQDRAARTIDVAVDPRTELLSIVFRLAGHPEYRQPKLTAYAAAADAHFGAHADHAVVQRARALRRTRGVSYDAPMSFAVHLTQVDGAFRFATPLDPWPEALDARWTRADAEAFLADLDAFAKVTDFAGFVSAQAAFHAAACARVSDLLAEHTKLAWFDAFFGARPQATFRLSLGMLNGGANYGPRARDAAGNETLYSVLGVWLVDADGAPTFDESVVSTIVHEFCHSYCNHLIDARRDELRPAGEALWPHVEPSMRAQAYGNWETMLRESLVRACVVRYLAATRGERAARMEIEVQRRNDFLWIEGLADLLATYEATRTEHPALADFMPRVVALFAEQPARVTAQLASTPKVVSIVPAIGSRDVDPTTTAIVVTFDRPMRDRAWSVVGGGPAFPESTGAPSYDETRTVLTIPVRLKPAWDYDLWLNRGRFVAFQSAQGVALRPVHVTFRTR